MDIAQLQSELKILKEKEALLEEISALKVRLAQLERDINPPANPYFSVPTCHDLIILHNDRISGGGTLKVSDSVIAGEITWIKAPAPHVPWNLPHLSIPEDNKKRNVVAIEDLIICQ